MKIVPTHVDSHLWVSPRDLPTGTIWVIKEKLSFVNEEKKQARREHISGWEEMPDKIELWSELAGKLIMPRGFASDYSGIIELFGGTVKWEDKRSMVLMDEEYAAGLKPIVLREH